MLACLLAALAGCATPGPPQPPSLNLPRVINDLEAARVGNRVTLSWTPPAQTTDKVRIRRAGPTMLCRVVESSVQPANSTSPQPASGSTGVASTCDSPNGALHSEIPASEIKPLAASNRAAASPMGAPAAARVTYQFDLPAELTTQAPAGAAVYSVEELNTQDRGAGFSNPVAVPLAPALAAPAGFQANVQRNGVELRWQPPAMPASLVGSNSVRLAGYRIERTQPAAAHPDERLLISAELARDGRYLDSPITWNKHYNYRIAVITGVFAPGGAQVAEVQGEWSPAVEVETRDVFPPAAPVGVQAIFTQAGSERYVDLTWLPVADPDVAGYFVYRRSENSANAAPQKITPQALNPPTYRDAALPAPGRYFYSVSAVDLRGNESPRSAEASEVVPP